MGKLVGSYTRFKHDPVLLPLLKAVVKGYPSGVSVRAHVAPTGGNSWYIDLYPMATVHDYSFEWPAITHSDQQWWHLEHFRFIKNIPSGFISISAHMGRCPPKKPKKPTTPEKPTMWDRLTRA